MRFDWKAGSLSTILESSYKVKDVRFEVYKTARTNWKAQCTAAKLAMYAFSTLRYSQRESVIQKCHVISMKQKWMTSNYSEKRVCIKASNEQHSIFYGVDKTPSPHKIRTLFARKVLKTDMLRRESFKTHILEIPLELHS